MNGPIKLTMDRGAGYSRQILVAMNLKSNRKKLKKRLAAGILRRGLQVAKVCGGQSQNACTHINWGVILGIPCSVTACTVYVYICNIPVP